jgi:LacI family transcriptional regulator
VKDEGVSSVTSNDADGIAAVVDHLVGLGHRKIAYISGPEQLSTSHARLAAFKKWSKKAGLIESDAQIITAAAFQETEGERCAAALLDSRGKFTAIACANDLLAIGAISALDRRGLSCPLQTTVTGFNDIPFVDRISPSLTTVRVQQYQMGWIAAGLLMDNIAKPQKQRTAVHVVLPVTLIVRASSGPPSRSTGQPKQTKGAQPNDRITSSEVF